MRLDRTRQGIVVGGEAWRPQRVELLVIHGEKRVKKACWTREKKHSCR